MTVPGLRASPRGEWMSIHEASAMIGVSPATLRRWSDAGEVQAFTTPGGHRRFSRAAIASLLPSADPGRPHLAQLGETPERMARVYRRELQRAVRWAPWIAAVGEAERAALRDHGNRIITALLDIVDATDAAGRSVALVVGERSAFECGRIAGSMGLPIDDTVQAFLHFRMPLIHELGAVGRRRALGTRETTTMLETATEALDRLLAAVMAGHLSTSPATVGPVAGEA